MQARTQDDTAVGRTARPWAITPAFALAWLAGVLAVQALPSLPSIMLDVAIVVASVAALSLRRLRYVAVAALGFAWCAWRAHLAFEARLPEDLEGRDVDIVGIVEDLPAARADGVRATVLLEQARLDGAKIALSGKARLTWYAADADRLAPCSRWQLRVRLKRPRGLVNPGGFDGERSALERGIVATGYVREDSANRRIGERPVCVDALRDRLARAIEARVADPHDAALLRAFAIGDTRGLDEDDWDIARINGIPHLIAISGFHVGVAAGLGALFVRLLGWLFPRLGLRVPIHVAAVPAALAVGVLYGILAGGSLPTVRTLLMIATVALARASRRAGSGAQTLALALVAVLAVDPLAVLSSGFWLSFVGVAFLMLCLARRHGVLGFARELGAGQLVMSLSLLPLTIWFFGEASLIGALANLVAVPFVSFVIVPLCLVGVLALLAVPPLAAIPLSAAALCAHVQWWFFERMAALPGAHAYVPEPSLGAVVLAMLGALWLLAPRGVPARALGLCLFVPLLLPPGETLADGAFEAVFIDVGQGLAVLVRTRGHAMLYDAGARYPSEFDLGKAAVLPTVHALGIGALDEIMISHGDNDHAGGAPAVAHEFPDARLVGGDPGRGDLALRQCLAGEAWDWDGVHFQVLAPSADLLAPDPHGDNDRSCVLLVAGRGGRLLLTGDITSRVEPRVAAQVEPDAAPLVRGVAHHGSRTSSGADFIAALHPALAIVSAGWRSRYGHPHPEVVARFREAGVPLLNTAGEGALTVAFPADAAPIARAERAERRRYWRERSAPVGSASQSADLARCYDSPPSGCDDP